ncbi:O-methyltransferase [Pseudonocardia sediminis]|uniref:O-methyltransferase n=1 Tax=Pseudonocardia sediminis TaxID=1397368 RepID=UPI001F5FF453|nr:class I SAM-dependent methyltransferase [Pseudonocardia sediminis]
MGSPRPVTPASILAALLEDMVRRVEATEGIDEELRSDLRRAGELAGGLDPYLDACTTPESPELAELVRRTQAEDWDRRAAPGTYLEQEMLSGHVEGQFLKFLVHATRARRVLDIGMFTGYSALAMAEALPPDGDVVACEVDGYVAEFAQSCFRSSPSGHRITVRVGPAIATLGHLADAGDRFDLVFIDADKAGYAAYLDAVLESDLLAPHGVVCVDNTLMQGLPWSSGPSTVNGDAITAFNRAVVDDPRVEQVLVPLRDGLTLIRRAPTGGDVR